MDTVNAASFYIEIVKVCSHLNLNEEDGSSEDISIHPEEILQPTIRWDKQHLVKLSLSLHKIYWSFSRIIPYESNLYFSLKGFCQSELHRFKSFCHVFHQFVFSLLEENQLKDKQFLIFSINYPHHIMRSKSQVGIDMELQFLR